MIIDIIKYILQFIFIVLFQVVVLNSLQLNAFLNPYLYVLFILLLPFETPVWLVLIMGFLLGLAIDIFSNTPGLHASATVFMAYLRSYILKLISPREGNETGGIPTLQYLGWNSFLSYSGILVIIHHFLLFYLEIFRFTNFFTTFLRAICSALFTMLLLILSQFLLYKSDTKK